MHDESKAKREELENIAQEYKYGFITDAEAYQKVETGLNEDIIREISKAKGEPEWMLEFRLKSLKAFYEAKDP